MGVCEGQRIHNMLKKIPIFEHLESHMHHEAHEKGGNHDFVRLKRLWLTQMLYPKKCHSKIFHGKLRWMSASIGEEICGGKCGEMFSVAGKLKMLDAKKKSYFWKISHKKLRSVNASIRGKNMRKKCGEMCLCGRKAENAGRVIFRSRRGK